MKLNSKLSCMLRRFSKKLVFLTILFSLASCFQMSADKVADSGPEDNSELNVSVDSNGRPYIAVLDKKTHDLSSFIDKHKDKNIQSFKIIRPSGEVHFESSGGLPPTSKFSLPSEDSKYRVEIKTQGGNTYAKGI